MLRDFVCYGMQEAQGDAQTAKNLLAAANARADSGVPPEMTLNVDSTAF